MKQFKFLILLLLLTVPMLLIAQDTTEPPAESVNVLSIAIQLIVGVLSGALITAINHITAGTFNFDLWFTDTLRPALWALLASAILAVVDLYVPFLDALFESVFQISTDANNTTALAATAFVLVPIIKGFLKREQTKAKVASK